MHLHSYPRSFRLMACGVAIAVIALSGRPLAQTVQITGAGATFPYPIYSAWFARYASLKPDVVISYLAVGSGAGIQQFVEGLMFFGATDTPMLEEEIQEGRSGILHLPTVVGAVVPVYSLPGLSTPIRFSGPVLSDIFLGRIASWNDAAIAKLNPGVTLPPTQITVVYRSDRSGTSFIWSDFLSKTAPEWRKLVGANRAPRLLKGVGVQGSERMTTTVKQTPGALGYVEFGYATAAGLQMGSVLNAQGEFVAPSVTSTTAAAMAAVGKMPRDFRVSITNAPGEGVYPIASFTWLLLYQRPSDKRRAGLMVDFARWALTDGQALASDLGFAPIPEPIVQLELTALQRIRTE